MTAVASFLVHDYPVVLADILLSGEEQSTPTLLPTIGPHTQVFPEGSGFSIVGF